MCSVTSEPTQSSSRRVSSFKDSSALLNVWVVYIYIKRHRQSEALVTSSWSTCKQTNKRANTNSEKPECVYMYSSNSRNQKYLVKPHFSPWFSPACAAKTFALAIFGELPLYYKGCNFINKRDSGTGKAPVNFAKFLRTPFLTEHHQWLFLNYDHDKSDSSLSSFQPRTNLK